MSAHYFLAVPEIARVDAVIQILDSIFNNGILIVARSSLPFLFFPNSIQRGSIMARKAKVTEKVVEVELPHGFVAIPTIAMELDVEGLKRVITPRMDSLRKAIGTKKAEKLSEFCSECLQFGKTVYVAVVAKMSALNGAGQSYLCICPCGDGMNTFVISGTFLKSASINNVELRKPVVIAKTLQKNVECAT